RCRRRRRTSSTASPATSSTSTSWLHGTAHAEPDAVLAARSAATSSDPTTAGVTRTSPPSRTVGQASNDTDCAADCRGSTSRGPSICVLAPPIPSSPTISAACWAPSRTARRRAQGRDDAAGVVAGQRVLGHGDGEGDDGALPRRERHLLLDVDPGTGVGGLDVAGQQIEGAALPDDAVRGEQRERHVL